VDWFFSLAPGFSPVTCDGQTLLAASAAFIGRKKPLKRLGRLRPSLTGLKPGVNETDMANEECILQRRLSAGR
jgi:hypothetical protein